MEIVNKSFTNFLQSLNIERYKIQYCRVKDTPYIYVKTSGLNKIGMKEIFTVSKSPYLDDAEILIKLLVRRFLDTDQRLGVRKDLIRHPKEGYQIRYLIRECRGEIETLLVISPDENNRLPGEKGYIRSL